MNILDKQRAANIARQFGGDELEKSANKHDFSTKEREQLSKKKEAMPDGSFPIRNEQDLKDAIRSVGRASNPAAAKAWIKKRAKALGCEGCLPDDWKDDEVEKGEEGVDDNMEYCMETE